MEVEPWMVRTGVIISALYLLNGALYAVNVWLRRRNSARYEHLIQLTPNDQDHHHRSAAA
jgi:hypothetical protein